jgi:uncharacterized FAD-dependent dehydrogenase
MRKTIEINLTPQQVFGEKNLVHPVSKFLRIDKTDIGGIKVLKRSVDSRSRNILVRMRVEVFINEEFKEDPIVRYYKQCNDKHRVVIVGAGPAGLFAALKLLEQGIKPVVLERGKDVHARKIDIARLNRQQEVNQDSNYCFGEGGAGTFSDGKLYTRSTKRGNVQEILETLVYHGANKEILIDSHPHIGSDKLPPVIEKMRETILAFGGEFHFSSRVTDIIISDGKAIGVIDHNNNKYTGKGVILATGHSSKDIIEMLIRQQILVESKPFAMGIRIEHPQALIDSIQYHSKTRSQYLPAAAYSLVTQTGGRGVFSFCMCPGGTIVPSATGENQVVVNGMSNSRRNSPYANSGIVVGIDDRDLVRYQEYGPLKGLKLQEHVEKLSFMAGGSCQRAPAQRLTDFLSGKISPHLPDSSYFPGLTSYPLHQVLPDFITTSLMAGFREFDKKMRGFITEQAIIVGVESRTSSPVRIPRDETTLQHVQVLNLYPCGEGSGYAGGIVSSAIDGERVAMAVSSRIFP